MFCEHDVLTNACIDCLRRDNQALRALLIVPASKHPGLLLTAYRNLASSHIHRNEKGALLAMLGIATLEDETVWADMNGGKGPAR